MISALASPLASNIALLCSFAVQVGLFIAWQRAVRRATTIGNVKGLMAIRDYTAGQKSGTARKVHRMAVEALSGDKPA